MAGNQLAGAKVNVDIVLGITDLFHYPGKECIVDWMSGAFLLFFKKGMHQLSEKHWIRF